MPSPRSQILTQVAAETYEPLRRLPIELQAMIFKLALPGPRIITIAEHDYQIRQADLTINLDLEQGTPQKETLEAHDPLTDDTILTFRRAVAIQTTSVVTYLSNSKDSSLETLPYDVLEPMQRRVDLYRF
ncbi:hypothetical protein SBOR_3883 [Sclerotinia borealis F-4128]|uniref:2EXR domain-containing protein n=1 Tax=Sclerotinia borealis (strain F-4128) TaxID=1432307 RepID=W9CM33_SCLBF|nr:hypothetical protein SBOR_3883 [Sclerotinia borealis F-4128]